MTTYKEIIYMLLDEIKGSSDDFKFTELHIKFLIDKYRALALHQKYSKGNEKPSDSNTETICIPLKPFKDKCSDVYIAVGEKKIPETIVGTPRIFIDEYSDTPIYFVGSNRFNFVGKSRFNSGIYATLTKDNTIKMKSNNIGLKYVECVYVTGVFESTATEDTASEGSCYLDSKFPLEEALIPVVMEYVRKEIMSTLYNPEDNTNNANDDIPDRMLLARAKQGQSSKKNEEG